MWLFFLLRCCYSFNQGRLTSGETEQRKLQWASVTSVHVMRSHQYLVDPIDTFRLRYGRKMAKPLPCFFFLPADFLLPLCTPAPGNSMTGRPNGAEPGLQGLEAIPVNVVHQYLLAYFCPRDAFQLASCSRFGLVRVWSCSKQ